MTLSKSVFPISVFVALLHNLPSKVDAFFNYPPQIIREVVSLSRSETLTLFAEDQPHGLYRKFADHAWNRLEESGMFVDASISEELSRNQAPAKGMKDSFVQISTKAMVPSSLEKSKLVKYARVALLETVSLEDSDTEIHTSGIQVLNFVVIPSDETNLPGKIFVLHFRTSIRKTNLYSYFLFSLHLIVLGIDLVTLPGNRNLLLLDAQPMVISNPYEEHWKDWYVQNVADNEIFPWGGDFPEPVQKYVSKYALWSRLSNDAYDPVEIIQQDLWNVFTSHLDLYLELLENSSIEEVQGDNNQVGYLEYRRSTDPAKPMLNSLYGEEWTNKLLDEVLFPPSS
jgi:phycoerythrobilin:ferredoxin oxidoreductase